MNRKVIIKIKDGKASIDAVGFEGSSCSLATKSLESRLGTVDEVIEKPEMWSTNVTTNTITQGV